MLFFYKCLLAGYVFSQVRSFKYRIVASRSTSRLVTCLGLFRLLMKGIFGPYVLWPLDKKLIFWIVTRVSARDYTVIIFSWHGIVKLLMKRWNHVLVKYRGSILRVTWTTLGSDDLNLDQSWTSIQILPEPNSVFFFLYKITTLLVLFLQW